MKYKDPNYLPACHFGIYTATINAVSQAIIFYELKLLKSPIAPVVFFIFTLIHIKFVSEQGVVLHLLR